MTTAERIVSSWTDWRLRDDWIKQNPEAGAKPAFGDDQGNKKTFLEAHHEKFDELNAEFNNLFVIGILRDDPRIFREVAAAISEKRRVASKLIDGKKYFDWKDFLLLKTAHEGKTIDVPKLASY